MPRTRRSPRRSTIRLAIVVVLAALATGCELPGWITDFASADEPAPTTTPAATTTAPVAPGPTTASSTTTLPATSTTSAPSSDHTAAGLCERGTAPGPASPPSGAVRVDPGDDVAGIVRSRGAGATFWFAPGTHAVTASIDAQTGDRFVGAPGAVLDGGFRGVPAFAGGGTDVTIRHLTVQRFGTADGHGWVNGSAINRTVADRWTVEDSTVRLNDGNALFLGNGGVARRSCFADNGQTGLAAPSQVRNGAPVSLRGIVVDGNEVVDNNRNHLETAPGGCTGCTAGIKLWQTTGAVVSDNVIRGNHGVGLWLDNNNVDTTVSGNEVRDNDREGVMVETSYNARIVDNDVVGNAVVDGRGRTDNFPVAGIFVSNSGGSSRLAGPAVIEVSGNRLVDNWNGVVVFWDADRYCGSAADSSVGHCTLGGATLESCAAKVERPDSLDALIDDCHWQASGVLVHDNEFTMTPAFTSTCRTRCGRNGLTASTAPPTTKVRHRDGSVTSATNPLAAGWARLRVVDPARNRFTGNRYDGAWSFDLGVPGQPVGLTAWHNARQDTP